MMDETKSKLWQKKREEVRQRENIDTTAGTVDKDANTQNDTTNNAVDEKNAAHGGEGEDGWAQRRDGSYRKTEKSHPETKIRRRTRNSTQKRGR